MASIKSQMKKADKSGASYALILGSNELAEKKAALKDLKTGEQELIYLDKVINTISKKIAKKDL